MAKSKAAEQQLSPLEQAQTAIARAEVLDAAGEGFADAVRGLAAALPPGDPASGAAVVLRTAAERPEDAAGLLKAQAEHLAWLAQHSLQIAQG